MGNKLILEQIAPYLPYGIKFISELDKPYNDIGNQPIWTMNGFEDLFGDYCFVTKEKKDAYPINLCKLILHPLSDLTKHCEDLGFVPIYEIQKEDQDMYIVRNDIEYIIRREGIMGSWTGYRTTESLPYWLVQLLLKWHFDVDGLIEKGLAIDINTLKDGK